MSSGGAACQRLERDEEPIALDLDGDCPDHPLVRTECLARLERDHPVVQRAGHRSAVDDALAERTASVWAMVLQREDLVVGRAEDADLAARGCHATRAALRDVSDRSYGDPV